MRETLARPGPGEALRIHLLVSLVRYRLLVHVPRNQCYEGSRGRQHGLTHLHVLAETRIIGRIHRLPGRALCGRDGWYERSPEFPGEDTDLCPRCAEIAARA